jgi:hypothetical protein
MLVWSATLEADFSAARKHFKNPFLQISGRILKNGKEVRWSRLVSSGVRSFKGCKKRHSHKSKEIF